MTKESFDNVSINSEGFSEDMYVLVFARMCKSIDNQMNILKIQHLTDDR